MVFTESYFDVASRYMIQVSITFSFSFVAHVTELAATYKTFIGSYQSSDMAFKILNELWFFTDNITKTDNLI